MDFRFSRLFWLQPLASLKTSPDRLNFVPMFLKLFASTSLGFLFSWNLSDYCLGLLLVVSDISLGGGVFRPVSEIGTSVLLLCLFEFEALRGSRACSVGVLHFLLFPCISPWVLAALPSCA